MGLAALAAPVSEEELLVKFSLGSTPSELAAAKYILKRWPSKKFWRFFKPEFQLKSLWWFKSVNGRVYLDKHYRQFSVKEPKVEKIKLTKTNVGETIVFENKPKTLKDFINGKKKRS